MSGLPAYHPKWLIDFWFGTPGLNKLDPHLTMVVLGVFGIAVLYVIRKQSAAIEFDAEEDVFKQLITQKNIIEKQLAELELCFAQKNITEKQYQEKVYEFQKHLEQTRQKLSQFT